MIEDGGDGRLLFGILLSTFVSSLGWDLNTRSRGIRDNDIGCSAHNYFHREAARNDSVASSSKELSQIICWKDVTRTGGSYLFPTVV